MSGVNHFFVLSWRPILHVEEFPGSFEQSGCKISMRFLVSVGILWQHSIQKLPGNVDVSGVRSW
tara:strand:- start:185 stop:376 length:192 start_codon:yes stop_codon:yes gene_type:complete